MNTIFSSHKNNRDIKLNSSEDIQESIYPFLHEINITNGSEFLDDLIRMREQPLGEPMLKEDA
jgi:hypothetical protein